MKGLLIKDWKLLKKQSKFFLCVVGIALVYTLFTDSMFFGIIYSTVMISMFTITTISYDEYNNGMSFLFTLPISRKGYAIEKYIFGCIAIVVSETALIGINGVILFFKEGGVMMKEQMEMLLSAGLGGGITVLLMMMLMIPIQLKWGAKKSQIVWIATFLAVAVIGGLVVKLSDMLEIDFGAFVGFFSHISIGWMIAAVVLLIVAGVLLSCKISVGIMEKKEF